MHPYIPFLLSDIKAAHRTEIPTEPGRNISFEEEMEDIEKWLEGEEPVDNFGYYCGLEAVNFPPPGQLTKKDMKLVCIAFKEMMYSWNLGIELPKKFPVNLEYSFLVNTLNEKTEIINNGIMSFDFCTGYAPDCVFKEYCMCLKEWDIINDEEKNQSSSDDSNRLPF